MKGFVRRESVALMLTRASYDVLCANDPDAIDAEAVVDLDVALQLLRELPGFDAAKGETQ